jgi:hypothetical protein
MVIPLFPPLSNSLVRIRRAAGASAFYFFFKAPNNLNSDQREKLRKADWLISAILREINQLKRSWRNDIKRQRARTAGLLRILMCEDFQCWVIMSLLVKGRFLDSRHLKKNEHTTVLHH